MRKGRARTCPVPCNGAEGLGLYNVVVYSNAVLRDEAGELGLYNTAV